MKRTSWTAPMMALPALIMLPFLAYFVSILYGSETFGNILSPLDSFLIAAVMLYAYIKSGRSHMSNAFLVFLLACAAWGIADLNWIILDLRGLDPSGSVFGNILYMAPNLVFLLVAAMFSVATYKKWNMVQMAVDSVIIVTLTVFLAWSLLFRRDFGSMLRFVEGDFISMVSILSDLFIILSILLYYLSLRSGNLPVFIKIISTGLFAYAIVDLVYYYLDFRGLYAPNSFIDFAYICSFELLAVGALWKTAKHEMTQGILTMENSGKKIRWVYLLVFPLISVLTQGFRTMDLVFFVVVIFFHGVSSSYVQISIENERLLQKEKNMNELLEQRVLEQVRELSYLANQDTLTSLLNRRCFLSNLEDAIGMLRDNETLAVMIIDLDRFKNINDSYGHNVGDLVLLEISRRLLGWNCCGATLARLGGDEFAVLVVGRYTHSDIKEYCTQIVGACGRPVTSGGEEIRLTISLGTALYTRDANTWLALMKNADIAMYRAKSQGYNKFMFYEDLLSDTSDKKIEIEKLLRKADFKQDFELFYQPQFSIADKKLIGAEALIRWKTAEHGYIPPNEFIPVAEEIDYIFEIGKWVMHRTICQCIDWNSRNGLNLKLGFNISPKQLDDDSFADVIRGMITEPGFNADWIDAEITENMMIKDENCVRKIFELFDSLGISVSIDDFGAGFASFGNLNRFKFSRLKIDKSLIDRISPEDFSGIQVVKAIVAMAHAIGVITIAEGVETQEQYNILENLDCDQVQGYLLGRPVPAGVFEEMFIVSPTMKIYPSGLEPLTLQGQLIG